MGRTTRICQYFQFCWNSLHIAVSVKRWGLWARLRFRIGMKQFVGRRSKDTVCEWLEFLKRKNIICPSRVDSEIFTETRMFKNGIYVSARTRPFKAGCASVRCLAESDKPSDNHPDKAFKDAHTLRLEHWRGATLKSYPASCFCNTNI